MCEVHWKQHNTNTSWSSTPAPRSTKNSNNNQIELIMANSMSKHCYQQPATKTHLELQRFIHSSILMQILLPNIGSFIGEYTPQKLRNSHCCVPFTATFSKRRKIGSLWSERCDAESWASTSEFRPHLEISSALPLLHDRFNTNHGRCSNWAIPSMRNLIQKVSRSRRENIKT